ncbi:Putrescine aminotransferase [compost metagenome]
MLLLGKALGGGMPLGAFISSNEIMKCLSHNPVLGHITTFGGHPVSCAAGKAAMEALLEEHMVTAVRDKEALFLKLLQHPRILNINSRGLMMAVRFSGFDEVQQVIKGCLEEGLFTDWFLFASDSIRIVPPLTISPDEITEACTRLIRVLDKL